MAEGYTVSATQDKHAERHSRRDYTPESADRALTDQNIVIYDCGNDREHFNEFFRPAIEEYNAGQTRADRKKSLDYLSALEAGTEGYGRGDNHEKPFYHDVVQIGNRVQNGVSDQDFDVDHWRELKAEGKLDEASEYAQAHSNTSKEREDFVEILREIAEEIRDNKDGKYGNILLHGAIIHRDEPNGTDHLDLRYTVFTDGETRGLSRRVSLRKGLGAMGYTTDKQQTALEKFREMLKDRIEEKMIERGYERKVLGEHRKHQPTEVYEMEQRAKDAEQRAEAAGNTRRQAAKMLADAINTQADLAARAAKLDEREAALNKRESEITRGEDDLQMQKKLHKKAWDRLQSREATVKALEADLRTQIREAQEKAQIQQNALIEREKGLKRREKEQDERGWDQDERERDLIMREEDLVKRVAAETEREHRNDSLIKAGRAAEAVRISESVEGLTVDKAARRVGYTPWGD